MTARTAASLVGTALGAALAGWQITVAAQGPVKPESVCEAMRVGLTEALARQHSELEQCREAE